ncbi:hypothetical protein [Streptomyces sp. NPDC088733]|uniref:hypothetical protein n=1 Tax=Streptomyces sp. NPDC088733 TaxID=3365880 RepID=UPI0037F653E7
MTEQSRYLPRIRQAWANTDDSGERLAAVDMDPHRFKAIIDGAQRPTSTDLAVIATAFGVTVDWLGGGPEPRLGFRPLPPLPSETPTGSGESIDLARQLRRSEWYRQDTERRVRCQRERAEKAEAVIGAMRIVFTRAKNSGHAPTPDYLLDFLGKALEITPDDQPARLALELHTALGLPAHEGVEHQGHDSFDAWWTELLATARALATRPQPARDDWAEDIDDWAEHPVITTARRRITAEQAAAIADANVPPGTHITSALVADLTKEK